MWSVTEPVSGVTIELNTVAGDIVVEEVYTTAVHRSLRGSTVWVSDGDPQPPTITLPEILVRDFSDVQRLRTLRGLSRRVVLTDDEGHEWPCRFVGSFSYRSVDIPARAELPLYYVKLTVVGVA